MSAREKRRKPSASFLAIKRCQRTKIRKLKKLVRRSKKSGRRYATIAVKLLKFIHIPKKNIRQDDLNKAIKQFDHDFYLKVFFDGDGYTSEDEEEPI